MNVRVSSTESDRQHSGNEPDGNRCETLHHSDGKCLFLTTGDTALPSV